MPAPSNCPECRSEHIYEDGGLWICPECGHEWNPDAVEAAGVIRDANGNALADGDSVTVVKDLKVKGAAATIKAGTKVRGIRLLADASDGHDIACRIDGIGALNLKSAVVKKA